MRGKRVELRRHEHRQRDRFARDRAERRRGVELRVQEHRRAGMQRRQRLDAKPADVKERQRRQHAVGSRQVVHLRAVHRIDEKRLLREQRALRRTGRARRVAEQHRGVGRIGIEAVVRSRGLVGRVAVAPPGGHVAHCEGHARREDGRNALGRVGETRLDEDSARRAIARNARELGRREPPVERHEDRTQARAGEQQRERSRVVVAEVRDAVAGRHTRAAQQARCCRDARREIAIRDRIAFETHRSLAWREARVAVDPLREVHARDPTNR
jgi:hypothetical protein